MSSDDANIVLPHQPPNPAINFAVLFSAAGLRPSRTLSWSRKIGQGVKVYSTA
jgi:hypothetical protein